MSSGSEDGHIIDFGPGFDTVTFCQILEMDDSDTDRSFSRELVADFLTQARDTFDKIRAALEAQDLAQLSDLGHYLKGSSAALGLTDVQVHCQKIQQFGKKQSMEEEPLSEEKSLSSIKASLEALIVDFELAETKLKNFYIETGDPLLIDDQDADEDDDDEDGEEGSDFEDDDEDDAQA